MSVEPVKKRGRPKKAISQSISAENIEPVKNGSQQKSTETPVASSTKTANMAPKPLTVKLDDAPDVSIGIQKKTSKTKDPIVAINTLQPSPEATSEMLPLSLNSSTSPSSPPKVTSTNSKILNQVRTLSSKAPSAAKSSRTTSKAPNPPAHASPAKSKGPNPPSQTNTAKSSSPLSPPKPSPAKKGQEIPAVSQPAVADTSSSQPLRSPSSPSRPQTQHPQKSIPVAALNSSVVSQLSSRAGARPGRPSADLPPKYKPVARRLTLAIVALPVVAVTSWVLYERMVLGEGRKELVRPGLVLVDESPSMRDVSENVSEKDA